MTQVDRIYKRAFRRHFTNHQGNFPPSQLLKLGDFGIFKNGYFIRQGNIGDAPYKIKFKILKDDSPTNEEFQSQGQVSTKNMAKGDIGLNGVPVVKPTFEIKFNSEKAVFFSSANVLYNQIDNVQEVVKQILDHYNAGNWEKRFVVITRIIEGENVIIVISGDSDCTTSLVADANIPKIDLFDASIKLDFSISEKVSYKIISKGLCQIGFGISRVYNPLFNKPTYKSTIQNESLFTALDENKLIDINNITFGDVMPGNYDFEE